jgi:hypothetical protein
MTSFSSSNEESDASSEKEIKNKKGKKRDKRSYNTTSFNYDNLPSCSAFTSIPIGKVLHFDGTDYTKWKYVQVLTSSMKMKDRDLSNYNKFIEMLKRHPFFYSQ